MAGDVIVLAFNAGSSSLKHTVLEMPAGTRLDRGQTGGLEGGGHAAAAVRVLDALAARDIRPRAVGHRVVHGGDRHAPALADDTLLAELEAVAPLAPLHVPVQLEVIRAARERLPEVPHVACFDTAFHRAMPEVAQRLPLPEAFWAGSTASATSTWSPRWTRRRRGCWCATWGRAPAWRRSATAWRRTPPCRSPPAPVS